MRIATAATIAIAAVCAGCFSVNYGDVGFECGAGGACPDDYECRSDNRCHRIGSPDIADAEPGRDARTNRDAAPEIDSGPPPANDECGGAITLDPATPLTGQSIANAGDDATGLCASGGGDVAYQFTIAGNQRARIEVTNADFDPRVVLQGTTCPGADVACADGDIGATEQLEEFDLPPDTYTVWVDTASGGSTFDIDLELLPAIPEPPNDDCSSPDLLPVNTTRAGTTLGGDDDLALEAVCLASDGPDTVHQISLGAAAGVLITVTPTVPTDWPIAVSLRDAASCAVADPDLGCRASSPGPRLINKPNLPLGSYSVIVDGAGGEAGDYTIRYATRAADSTFGYLPILTTGNTYTPMTGTFTQIGTTVPPGNDDVIFHIPDIGFTFPYHGSTVGQVWVATNGWLTLTDPAGMANLDQFFNDCPLNGTTPHNTIAVFWDDMFLSGTNGSVMRHQTVGTAPNRRFVVEWVAMGIFESTLDGDDCPGGCNSLATSVTQMVVLHENGDIEFRYGPRTAPGVSRQCGSQHLGCSATIGLENVDGSDVDSQAACNTNSIANGHVIYWVHPTP